MSWQKLPWLVQNTNKNNFLKKSDRKSFILSSFFVKNLCSNGFHSVSLETDRRRAYASSQVCETSQEEEATGHSPKPVEKFRV